jgi:ABC-type Fe3+-hydroxamate transport system substrate-binding protein
MPKSFRILSLAAAASLAACATHEAATPQAPVSSASGSTVMSSSGAAVTSAADTGRIVTVPASPAPAGVASVPALRAGYGIVEAVSLVYQAPTPSASAGGTAAAVPGPFRLMLRMDDGSLQNIVQDYRGFMVGDRVQVTTDGRILR